MSPRVRAAAAASLAVLIQQVVLFALASRTIYASVQFAIVTAEAITLLSCTGVLHRFVLHHGPNSRYWPSVLRIAAAVHLVGMLIVSAALPSYIVEDPRLVALVLVLWLSAGMTGCCAVVADVWADGHRPTTVDAAVLSVQVAAVCTLAITGCTTVRHYIEVICIGYAFRTLAGLRLLNGVTRWYGGTSATRLKRAFRVLRLTLLQKIFSATSGRLEALVIARLFSAEVFALYSFATSVANVLTSRVNALVYRIASMSRGNGRARLDAQRTVRSFLRPVVPTAIAFMVAVLLLAPSLGKVAASSSGGPEQFAAFLTALSAAAAARMVGGILGPVITQLRLDRQSLIWSAVVTVTPIACACALWFGLAPTTAVALSCSIYCLLMPVGFVYICRELLHPAALASLVVVALTGAVLSIWTVRPW